MLSLTSKILKYAVLLKITVFKSDRKLLNLKRKEVTEEIFGENDFLMDPYDREILLRKIFDRAN